MPREPSIDGMFQVERPGRRPYWQIRAGGKLHHLGTDERDARRAARRILADHFAGRPVDGDPVTVAEAAALWSDTHGGEWEASMVETWAAMYAADDLRQLGSDHLKHFARDLARRGYTRAGSRRDYSASVLRAKVKIARRVLTWCAGHGWIDTAPPMPAMPKPATGPRDVDGDDLAAVWAKLPKHAKPILTFIVATGCRPGEACRLVWSQVDLDRGVCVVAEHKTARVGEVRSIYLTPAARSVLEALTRRTGPVFVSRLGRPYTPSGLRSILRRRGINGAYALRHTFAQHALDSGTKIEDVAKLLGHRSLRQVQTYAQVRDARAREVAASLSGPLPDALAGVDPPRAKVPPKPRASRRRTTRKSASAHANRRAG